MSLTNYERGVRTYPTFKPGDVVYRVMPKWNSEPDKPPLFVMRRGVVQDLHVVPAIDFGDGAKPVDVSQELVGRSETEAYGALGRDGYGEDFQRALDAWWYARDAASPSDDDALEVSE